MQENQDASRSFSALQQYLRQVKWTPRLTEEEEAQLLQQPGCEQARARLVEGYQPMVLGMAKRYQRQVREMELMDLVQEGNEGLLRALQGYDGSLGEASFRTWAFAWIRGMMYRALLREGAIRLPQRKAEAIRQMDAISDDLHCLLGRQPTVTEMAWEMGVSERDLYELMVLQARRVVSLDVPVDEDGEVALAETIEDSTVAGVDEAIASPEDLLRYVTEQQRAVLLVRYGFGDGQPCTQAETARLLGMKFSKVQELDRRARIRLRRALASSSA